MSVPTGGCTGGVTPLGPGGVVATGAGATAGGATEVPGPDVVGDVSAPIGIATLLLEPLSSGAHPASELVRLKQAAINSGRFEWSGWRIRAFTPFSVYCDTPTLRSGQHVRCGAGHTTAQHGWKGRGDPSCMLPKRSDPGWVIQKWRSGRKAKTRSDFQSKWWDFFAYGPFNERSSIPCAINAQELR